MPCPYHLKEGKDEEEDESGRMAERRGDALWLLFAGDVVAMWWRWHRPEPDVVAFLPSPCAMLRAGEAASG